MLFLANMRLKMKHDTPLGSRIAEVHNGSSLFTGDAGQGESNIRRWIIENDWLEAIVALPLNMFYNTGIATYIWVLTNRKPEHRKGKVQLIDATQWFKPLRKNLGKKNCELSRRGHRAHLRHVPRLRGDRAVEDLPERRLRLLEGDGRAPAAARRASTRTAPTRRRRSRRSRRRAERDDDAPPVITKIHKKGTERRSAARPVRGDDRRQARASSSTSPTPTCATPSRCRCSRRAASRPSSPRGAAARADAWYRPGERQDRLRDQLHPLLLQAAAAAHLEEIRADILALEKETEGLLDEIVGTTRPRRDRRPQAVSRRIKDSGVAVAGMRCPEHWEVQALRSSSSRELRRSRR